MGNSNSGVTSGIKNQIGGSKNAGNSFYSIHSETLKGKFNTSSFNLSSCLRNGELAVLAKEALRNSSTDELDAAIKEKVTHLLYNEGKGDLLTVDQIIKIRHKERTGSDFTTPSNLKKYVCWKIDCRGSVGETLLHVCFLSGKNHMKLLAQRLIYLFPNVINDFYLCDEYYGETALHMGIVSEDAEIVRFLLRNGAGVDVRCTGNFFTSDDQKSSRVDSAQSEHALLCRHTYYTGHLYWGEYPLAFACCLSQLDCFRMLHAYGADPNAQDTNGNTVLHICCIHENWEMFDLALKCGAQLHIQNRQRLTALTLSAYLAKKEMFESIVKEERHIYWVYGNLLSCAYPLQHLDSIDPSTGEINRNSALALVVYGNSAEHLHLLPNLLEELVTKKWHTYARKELLKQLFCFTIYFILMFFCFLYRPTPIERSNKNSTLLCVANFDSFNYEKMKINEVAYAILNVLVVIGAALYLLQMFFHIKNVGKTMYFLSLSGFPAKSVFLVSCCMVIFTFLLRLLCMDKFEDIVWAICILLTAVKFLFFCRGFKSVGPFVLMLYKIIVRDLSRFVIIYCIFVIGFSQSFYILFLGYRRNQPFFYKKEEKSIMLNIAESFIRMFIMSLTEFAVLFEQLEQCELRSLGKITFIIYMLLVTMLLMNLLIAMMTDTYNRVSANSLEYIRQCMFTSNITSRVSIFRVCCSFEYGTKFWQVNQDLVCQIVNLDSEARLRFQRCYSVPLDGKGIGLPMKIRLSAEEQEQERQTQKQNRRRFNEEKIRQAELQQQTE
ncbi:Nanchung [Aphelenchoides bicaudatus]|nr:Nanchung [Aphelenchoides bicaudatus]